MSLVQAVDIYSNLLHPKLLYAIYLFVFPFFSYKWFAKNHHLQERDRIASYVAVIAIFYAWMYLIGPKVLIFEYPILAVMGIVQILKLIALTGSFLDEKQMAWITHSYRNYHLYLISPAEVSFNVNPKDVQKQTLVRLIRGSIHLCALITYNQILHYTTAIYPTATLPFLFRGILAGLQLSLCFQALTDLALALFGYVFPDIYLEDVFKYPILSESPREFWSKRWNLVIQKYIFKLVYIPMGGKHNKLLALLVIYLAVGLLHEIPMFFLPSAKFGYWFLIFCVHTGAMMTQFLVEKMWATLTQTFVVRLVYRLCTLILLAVTANFAYSGFGLSVDGMAKDFNALFFL